METIHSVDAIILNKDRSKVLYTVEAGDEKYLLLPGGTFGINKKPTRKEQLSTLKRELYEELSLNGNEFQIKKFLFTAKAAATRKDMLVILYCYLVECAEEYIKPNFIDGDSEMAVYLSVWVGMDDLTYINGAWNIRKSAKLKGVDSNGAAVEVPSDDLLFSEAGKKVVTQKLLKLGLLKR